MEMSTEFSPGWWNSKSLEQLTTSEWEALCDGCAKCCLHKLEDDDSGEVYYTKVACRYMSDSCRCTVYPQRSELVPICVWFQASDVAEFLWLPSTCAYRLVAEGKPLADWHPLISGTPDSVQAAGVSVQGTTVSEFDISEEDWEDYIIEEPI
jgi:uncharacterized cysteine cluster protein YcgN (CxxCxxCC family)